MTQSSNNSYNYNMKEITHAELIDLLGGTGSVSKLFKISSQAVSNMKRRGIPGYRLDYLALWRPKIFKEYKLKDIS